MTSVEMEIRTRLDIIFSKYTPNTQLTELKEELVADLLEAYQDFSKTDQSHDEALDDAFDQLGDIESILKELSQSESSNRKQEDTTTKRPYVDISNQGVHIGNLHINKKGVSLGDDIVLDSQNKKVQFGNWLHVDRDGARVGGQYYQFNNDLNSETDEDNYTNNENQHFNTPHWAKAHHRFTIPISSKTFSINYKEASINFYSNDKTDLITIDEFFSRDNPRYFSNVEENNDKIIIKQGDYPMLFHVRAKIYIGLPQTFSTGKIEVTNQSGNLYVKNLVADTFNIQLSAGTLDGQTVQANTANWNISSGTIKATHVNINQANIHVKLGAINIEHAIIEHVGTQVDLGSVRIDDFTGSGNFNINSGTIRLRINKLTNDLKLTSNSGDIRLTAPDNQDFNFAFAAQASKVSLAHENVHFTKNFDGYKSGFIGDNPIFTIDGQAMAGSVKIY
ncbi:hypothetical protein GCM10025879_11150 [Leuconostoc litchii]|uniref:DUF4097 domain-containing protein n=1 Tax=Leuconostoc litchii TaxID=1981069 RepID=A0A6P2CJJ3_9LACO|nr:DUF4097 family beta strand repeat-containing protein [Leuconostoc litchii]TYC46053.1 hypothetical protein ESZ47_08455 [Leuconostoc litchii]GMA69869.1 hypothetical protein GCM10025879_11150 [Leuconostoc litchii]